MDPKILYVLILVILLSKRSARTVNIDHGQFEIFDHFGDETGVLHDQSIFEIKCSCTNCTNDILQVISSREHIVNETKVIVEHVVNETKLVGKSESRIRFLVKSTIAPGTIYCRLKSNNERSSDFDFKYRPCAPEEIDENCEQEQDKVKFCFVTNEYIINNCTTVNDFYFENICLIKSFTNKKICHNNSYFSDSVCESFEDKHQPTYVTSQKDTCKNDTNEFSQFQLRSVVNGTKYYMLGEYVQMVNGIFKFKVNCSGKHMLDVNVTCQTKLRGNNAYTIQSGKCGEEMEVQFEKNGSYIAKLECTPMVHFTARTFVYLVSMDASVHVVQSENVPVCLYRYLVNDTSFRYKNITWKRDDNETRRGNYPLDNNSNEKPFFQNGTFKCIGTIVFLAPWPYTRLETTNEMKCVFTFTQSTSRLDVQILLFFLCIIATIIRESLFMI